MFLTPSSANETEYQTAISARLNPTGRTVSFAVLLKDHDVALGDVTIQITADDQILVEKAGFATAVDGLTDDAQQSALNALADQGGFVPIDAFAATGVGVHFDTGLQELVLDLAADRRKTDDISLGGRRRGGVSSVLSKPEPISGYVNIIAGVDHDWDASHTGTFGPDGTSGRLELDSAIRLHGAVIENRASYEGNVDSNICPPQAVCTYGHVAGIKRQQSRIVYDLQDKQVRIQAGDTDALAHSIQRPVDLLGVSIEKSREKFDPGGSISSSGSFRLDRTSDVDVRINGTSVQRLRLRPGNYNLRDLPLAGGANDVELAITDDVGETRTLSFKAYADAALLSEGETQWGAAFGLESYLRDNERNYSSHGGMGTGFFRYGLSDTLTVEADAQGDSSVVMAGIGLTTGTDWGKFRIHGAGSTGTAGAGFAADFNWALTNFTGLVGTRKESLYLDAQYRSTDFHTPGDFLSTASGLLYPEFNYWLRLSGAYSVGLGNGMTAVLSGRYQFGDSDREIISPFTVAGDRYGADLTISKVLSETTSASMLVGYSNEVYPFLDNPDVSASGDFRAGIRFNIRPDEKTTLAASYDTLGEQSSISGYRSEGTGVGRWDTSVDVQNRGYEKSAFVNASGGYYGNRAEVRVSHFGQMDGVDIGDFTSTDSRQRTSVRVGTSIAFAGDKVAVGAPIRGGAFAIVSPHESLEGREVTVGSAEYVRAKADGLGPALVGDLPAYLPGTVPVDVDDLPIGYSLGRSSFDTFAPFKAGYALDVGSAHSVSVYGTLVDEEGAPVSLLTGTARPVGQSAPTVSVFTNASGRFGAEGLGPGQWIVEMATDGEPSKYLIDVPANANGLVKVGTLRPMQQQERN